MAERPWAKRTAELDDKEPSAWNDYAAWEAWMGREMMQRSVYDSGYDDWNRIIESGASLPVLYSVCCELFALGAKNADIPCRCELIERKE